MRVFTLTANLLAETTCVYPSWNEGATVRAREASFQVGGKGINVTRMLGRLGAQSEALCFPGGYTGARCMAWMREHGIRARSFETASETRSGWVVRVAGRPETTFLGPDCEVSEAAVTACVDFLGTQPDGNCLAICGSIPGWSDDNWRPLCEAVHAWTNRGTLVIDSYGAALDELSRLSCALVKINRKEFAGLAGVPMSLATDNRMPEILESVAANRPSQRWVVTDGGNAVWARDEHGVITSTNPPRVNEISPTGSGDVMLAALIDATLIRGRPLEEGLSFALPLAAANAASAGVADFDLRPFGISGR